MAKDRGKFGWLDQVLASNVNTAPKVVAAVLFGHADEDGKCFPGIATIARECNLSERHVKRCVQELKDAGKLSWLRPSVEALTSLGARDLRADKLPNLYQLKLDDVTHATPRSKEHEVTPQSPRGSNGVTPQAPGKSERGDTAGKNGVTPVSPNTTIDKSIEEPAKRAAADLHVPRESVRTILRNRGVGEPERSRLTDNPMVTVQLVDGLTGTGGALVNSIREAVKTAEQAHRTAEARRKREDAQHAEMRREAIEPEARAFAAKTIRSEVTAERWDIEVGHYLNEGANATVRKRLARLGCDTAIAERLQPARFAALVEEFIGNGSKVTGDPTPALRVKVA